MKVITAILEYYEYYPPLFWRHFVPWFVLKWIDKHSEFCWSSMVMWKLGYDGEDWEWRVKDGCFQWYPKNIFSVVKPCFCGKYPRGDWGRKEKEASNDE